MPARQPALPQRAHPERAHTERARAESFGSDADGYERIRPGYPPELFDDLLTPQPSRVLDVGCGTGKAARPILERGLHVLGVEVDERMAGVARSFGVEVETGGFESWDPAGRQFDLIVSGQAWHWIDPVVGPRKAAEVLPVGGLLAPFWNFAELDERARRALDATYHALAPELSETVVHTRGPATVPLHARDIDASGLFGPTQRRTYRWERVYPRDSWLALIQTHSDHRLLAEDRREALVRRVGEVIDSFGGAIVARYRTEVVLARRR